jgi:hypothetical protein
MNDKLRSILHTTWNEPRHFFFWLALLSVSGLVVLVVATGVGAPPPPPSLFFIGLGCILCFVTSVSSFILAWIPPVRRLFSRLLHRRFLALGCLVTLVALFYAIEDWRGRRAWQNYKRAWEAKGERFDLTSLVPPPVPSDQNFFETPLWNDMHFVHRINTLDWRDPNWTTTVWSDTNWHDRVIFDAFGPKGNNAPDTGSWSKAQRADWLAWQAYYRGSNNLFAAQSGPPTNYFPIAKEPQTPAADVLLALDKFKENRQLLIAASTRPQARFWINYDAGFAALLPHLARLKDSSVYLSLHANAALKAGDRDTALEDMRLLFRLIESNRSEPILISHLVRVATLAIALQPVWEGLADRAWTEAELRVIESELGKLDFLADYHFAIRGERASGLWVADFIRKASGGKALELATILTEGPKPGEWEMALGTAVFQVMPGGWFDQNKLSLCRLHEKYLQPLVVDRDPRIAPPAASRQARSVLEHLRRRPYDMLSSMLLPAITRFAERCARGQTFVDLARVACALERYRLANGQFPETLAALTPKFIETLPHDVINGEPLKYRRTDDGQFVLYSVGWNETDDGGILGLTKNGNWDPKKGDWLWHYPAR